MNWIEYHHQYFIKEYMYVYTAQLIAPQPQIIHIKCATVCVTIKKKINILLWYQLWYLSTVNQISEMNGKCDLEHILSKFHEICANTDTHVIFVELYEHIPPPQIKS